ncbi:hypothetical protein DFH07DRAFT_8342 [Mycena maculata]|uniref:Uncharacterized protein n=1 Tax=Mycena maculata TaxID=230809 RepID=A0AAD7KH10_9AGAR|nr:hypothetical protein DFH07DRAFT_8342 [Mycena maculata]
MRSARLSGRCSAAVRRMLPASRFPTRSARLIDGRCSLGFLRTKPDHGPDGWMSGSRGNVSRTIVSTFHFSPSCSWNALRLIPERRARRQRWTVGTAMRPSRRLEGRAEFPHEILSKICHRIGSTPSGGETISHSLVLMTGRYKWKAPRSLHAGRTGGERTAQARRGIWRAALRRAKTWSGRTVMGYADVGEISDQDLSEPILAHVRKDSKSVETGTGHFAAGARGRLP